jgi:hypothetical protein
MHSSEVQRNRPAKEDAREGAQKREELMHMFKDAFRR